jgi:hypothetical protein
LDPVQTVGDNALPGPDALSELDNTVLAQSGDHRPLFGDGAVALLLDDVDER